MSKAISECLPSFSLHTSPGQPFVLLLVLSIELLVKEMAGEQTDARGKERAGWLEKSSSLWAREPVCNSLCPNS